MGKIVNLISRWNQYTPKKKKKMYFLAFSILFFLMIFICFGYFYFQNKSFIWINGGKDGLAQNYNCLVYFSNYMRSFIKGIFIDHVFQFPQWDFGIGYGSDVISTMSIITIGDIFNWFSIFVSEKYIDIYYTVMGFVRLYLAGLFFSLYCFKMNKRYKNTLLGAFIYMFCGYVFISLPRHVAFINPMVFLPLLLIGVEKIYARERPYLFVITIMISIIGSFQYFYILCLAVIGYAVVRFFTIYHEKYFHHIIKEVPRFIFYAVIGILMGCVIFLPVIIRFLSDTRAAGGVGFEIFYPLKYYKIIVSSLISYQHPGGDWTYLVFSPIVLLLLITMFLKKGRQARVGKVIVVITSLMILSPIGGQIMNGFSFDSNRWIFIVSFILAFLSVSFFDDLFALSYKKIIFCGVFLILYCIFCNSVLQTKMEYTLPSLIMLVVIYIYVSTISIIKLRLCKKISVVFNTSVLLSLICISVALNAYTFNSRDYANYPKQFLDNDNPYEVLMNTGISEIEKVADNAFYRYEDWGGNSFYNSGLNYGVGSSNYFFSLSNPYIHDFYNQMSLGSGTLLYYENLDSRSILNSLASIRYISTNDKRESQIPSHYKLLKQLNNINIYENENVLPLGYTYENSISQDMFKQYNYIEKQHIMLDSIVLNNSQSQNDKKTQFNNIHELDYQMNLGDDISFENNTFKVLKRGAKVKIKIPKVYSDELYILMQNCKFQSIKLGDDDFWSPKESATIKMKGNVEKSFLIRSEEAIYYNPAKEDYSLNLQGAYLQNNQVEISFSEVGYYSMDEMNVTAVSLDGFKDKIDKLKSDILTGVSISNNQVQGYIDLKKDKILCLSIPYTDGWTAFVDGVETDIQIGNIMYMAIPLKAGNHKIVLKYSTPGLKIGCVLSLVGFVSFGSVIIYERKKRKLVK